MIDLFAGAGGLSTGAVQAGFEVLFANDFLKDMCATYQANHFNTHVHYGDVKDINPNYIKELTNLKYGELDVVAGGPPCQGFSTVGKKNEDDPRNALFKHFFKFIECFFPKVVLFENVLGFKSLYSGRAFNAVCDKLNKLGYNIKYDVLNAVNYGVPQNRRRTIIIGFRDGINFEFPTPCYGNGLFFEKVRTVYDAISDLPPAGINEYECNPITEYQELMRRNSNELRYHDKTNHGDHLIKIMEHIPYGGSIMDVPEELRPNSYFKNTYARMVWEKPSPTITRNFGTPSSSRCVHPVEDRALTSREGARLQSFSDSYIFCGGKTSINLQIGNAVPPLLSKSIFESIIKVL